jgi:50S ribosomal protein L16 3-hydroxylase
VSRLLGGLSPRAFLARHWQKKPLLVRGALPRFRDPLTPGELLGLACEPEVESRLVLLRGGRRPYRLIEGPQRAGRLRRLPAADWTLLVQGVDRLRPAAAALLERFFFFPRWRRDDVMVSFAARGGGVGAHVDNYDVFLIQGMGRRRWRIQERPEPALVRGLPLRVLRRFRADSEWVLGPGDMLYVPPGVAHEGVALEDSLTYSVGFRAPSHRALVAAFAERLLASIPEDRLYADPDLRPATNPRRLERTALARMLRIVRDEVLRGLRLDLSRELATLVGAATIRPRGRRGRRTARPAQPRRAARSPRLPDRSRGRRRR